MKKTVGKLMIIAGILILAALAFNGGRGLSSARRKRLIQPALRQRKSKASTSVQKASR